MPGKRHVIRLLLRAYPQRWRREYGEDLAALLLSLRLTPSVVLNIVLSGIRQHLRRAETRLAIGLCLFAWTAFAVNSAHPLSPRLYSHLLIVTNGLLIGVGMLTALKNEGSLRAAVSMSVKAGVASVMPDLLLGLMWAGGLLAPTIIGPNGVPHPGGGGLALLWTRSTLTPSPSEFLGAVAVVVLGSAFYGFLGGSYGRFVRKQLRSKQQHKSNWWPQAFTVDAKGRIKLIE